MQVGHAYLCVSGSDRINNDLPGTAHSMTVASFAPAVSTPQITRTITSLSLLRNSPAGAVTVVTLGPGVCPSHAHTILPAPKPLHRSLLMQPNIPLRYGVAISLLCKTTRIACPSLLSCAIV